MIATRTSLLAAPLLLSLSVAAAAQSQIGSATARPENWRSGSGQTLPVFQARHEVKLLAADTDGDGGVSQAEFLSAAKSGRRDPARRFARLDADGDGTLSKAEIDAQLARRFRRIDTNKDGVISPQERAAVKEHANGGQAARPS